MYFAWITSNLGTNAERSFSVSTQTLRPRSKHRAPADTRRNAGRLRRDVLPQACLLQKDERPAQGKIGNPNI